VIEPLWESRSDWATIMYQLANTGFARSWSVKNQLSHQVKGMDEPVPEDIPQRGSTSACGALATQLARAPRATQGAHAQHGQLDVKTLKSKQAARTRETVDLTGDISGLPWPCWGTLALKHPARPTCVRHQQAQM
jgi:formate dehydrogenase major subunit